jgi:hypothetical protein
MTAAEPKALSIAKFAKAYGMDRTTVWRALRDGRLSYVLVGKRKLVIPPPVQRAAKEIAA